MASGPINQEPEEFHKLFRSLGFDFLCGMLTESRKERGIVELVVTPKMAAGMAIAAVKSLRVRVQKPVVDDVKVDDLLKTLEQLSLQEVSPDNKIMIKKTVHMLLVQYGFDFLYAMLDVPGKEDVSGSPLVEEPSDVEDEESGSEPVDEESEPVDEEEDEEGEKLVRF